MPATRVWHNDVAFRASTNRLANHMRRCLCPPSRIPVSEAAQRDLYLSREYSKEAGRISLERYPHLREIMDRLSDSDPVKLVVVKACIQSGKSVIGQAFLVYSIVYSPAAFLWLTDTDLKAKKFSKGRLDAMVRDSPALAARVAKSGGRRDKEDTIHVKTFPGGNVTITGAQSASGVVSDTFRRACADEVDLHERDIGGIGSSIEQMLGRLSSWGPMGKALAVSSPTVEGESEIDHWYHLGDQRVFEVQCKHCGEFHTPEPCDEHFQNWNLIWSPDYSEIYYRCPRCGGRWTEADKSWFMPRGRWVATRPDLGGGVITSYYYNSLLNPLGGFSWTELAQQWDRAQKSAKAGDLTKLKTVVNQRFARVFRDLGDAIDPHALRSHLEPINLNALPARVRAVTQTTDVQDDRLETQWVAWGPGFEAWILKHSILYCNPDDSGPWRQLEELRLTTTFRTEDGRVLRSGIALVDSNDEPDRVYAYTTPRFDRGVYAIKSVVGRPREAIWDKTIHKDKRGKKRRSANRWFTIRTVPAKDRVYNNLRIAHPGPGYVHINEDILRLCPDYLDQIASEQRVSTVSKGRKTVVYKKKTDNARNEALDCFVYNLGAVNALRLAGMDLGDPDPRFGREEDGSRTESTIDDTHVAGLEPEPSPPVQTLNYNAPITHPRKRRAPPQSQTGKRNFFSNLGPIRRG